MSLLLKGKDWTRELRTTAVGFFFGLAPRVVYWETYVVGFFPEQEPTDFLFLRELDDRLLRYLLLGSFSEKTLGLKIIFGARAGHRVTPLNNLGLFF